ncbi:hypothetical protein RJ641_027180 [Dillenia turbinata]|uniref:Uncharacterized protein n=1 Tax=Dillenia turbinata TaxID=194707 RepID=A0AAN8W8C8_9MAGN
MATGEEGTLYVLKCTAWRVHGTTQPPSPPSAVGSAIDVGRRRKQAGECLEQFEQWRQRREVGVENSKGSCVAVLCGDYCEA